MQRKDTVTMSGEEFDSIHMYLGLVVDCIEGCRIDEKCKTTTAITDIRRWAKEALDIMDMEEYL